MKRSPSQLVQRVRPSTTANTISVLCIENANKQQIINSLHAQVEYHEQISSALPSSVRTLRREVLALVEENDALAKIIIGKDNAIAETNAQKTHRIKTLIDEL